MLSLPGGAKLWMPDCGSDTIGLTGMTIVVFAAPRNFRSGHGAPTRVLTACISSMFSGIGLAFGCRVDHCTRQYRDLHRSGGKLSEHAGRAGIDRR